MDEDFECCCDWPNNCGGDGSVQCEGCGGDFCVCECGGECECYGCPECPGDYDFDAGEP